MTARAPGVPLPQPIGTGVRAPPVIRAPQNLGPQTMHLGQPQPQATTQAHPQVTTQIRPQPALQAQAAPPPPPPGLGTNNQTRSNASESVEGEEFVDETSNFTDSSQVGDTHWYQINPWAYATNRGSILDRDTLSDGWTSRQILLEVGPDKTKILAPEAWLCAIGFFHSALRGNFREAGGVVALPEDDPVAIKSLLNWLVRGFDEDSHIEDWRKIDGQGWVTDLVPLADKFLIKELADQCYELIFKRCAEDVSGYMITENIIRCYHALQEHRARYLPIHVLICHGHDTDKWNELEARLLSGTQDGDFWGDFGKYKTLYPMLMNICAGGMNQEWSQEDSQFVIQSILSGNLEELVTPEDQPGAQPEAQSEARPDDYRHDMPKQPAGEVLAQWIRNSLDI